MIRGTTPTLTLTIPKSVDLTIPTSIYVTLAQGDFLLTKLIDKETDLDVDTNLISVFLSQVETLQLKSNAYVKVQVNWVYEDGQRGATKIETITVNQNLIDEVITP